MIKTRKYYFLPFVDNLTAVLVTILATLGLGNFLTGTFPVVLATIFFLCVLFGRTYVHMWRLSRKNARYDYGLTLKSFINFVTPLVIFDLVLILFYCLYDNGIIPSDILIISSHYSFPDDAPRQIINISLLEYIAIGIRVWFSYFIYVIKSGYILILSPALSFFATISGYNLGKKDMHIMDMIEKTINKIKEKLKNRGYQI